VAVAVAQASESGSCRKKTNQICGPCWHPSQTKGWPCLFCWDHLSSFGSASDSTAAW